MMKLEIDKEMLANEKNKITTWDDWDKLEEKIFKVQTWEETDINTLEKDLERPIITLDGYEWEPTTNSYNLPPEILHKYEKIRVEVFNKLEPEAAKENMSHPEIYAKWCVYCKRWSRKYPKDNCPKCGNELLPLWIGE